MTFFAISLRGPDGAAEPMGMLDFPSLDAAQADARAAIPDMAAALIRKGRNPFDYAYQIDDEAGAPLARVPLDAALWPAEPDRGRRTRAAP